VLEKDKEIIRGMMAAHGDVPMTLARLEDAVLRIVNSLPTTPEPSCTSTKEIVAALPETYQSAGGMIWHRQGQGICYAYGPNDCLAVEIRPADDGWVFRQCPTDTWDTWMLWVDEVAAAWEALRGPLPATPAPAASSKADTLLAVPGRPGHLGTWRYIKKSGLYTIESTYRYGGKRENIIDVDYTDGDMPVRCRRVTLTPDELTEFAAYMAAIEKAVLAMQAAE
jgi:hypothetical protein